jgi:hypothetical protein
VGEKKATAFSSLTDLWSARAPTTTEAELLPRGDACVPQRSSQAEGPVEVSSRSQSSLPGLSKNGMIASPTSNCVHGVGRRVYSHCPWFHLLQTFHADMKAKKKKLALPRRQWKISPVTRVKPSGKNYERAKAKREVERNES